MLRLIAGKTMHRRGRESDASSQYPRRRTSTRSSATAFPRANGDVWAVPGDVAELVAQGREDEVTQVSGARRALGVSVAFAVRALARACTSLARLGALHSGVSSAGFHRVKCPGCLGERERGLPDMVVQAREEG
jgi:hypothetical protein